jgi:hypothetical protein
VRTTKVYGNWRRATIQRAISVLSLIRITRAAKNVELRSPARKCPHCHEAVEVIVMPGGMCATCWSQEVISAWRVLPEDLRMTVAGGHDSSLRRETKPRKSILLQQARAWRRAQAADIGVFRADYKACFLHRTSQLTEAARGTGW